MVSMMTYAALFMWWLEILKTTLVSSSICPSRDVYDPSSLPPPPDIPPVTPTELWAYPYIVSLIEQHHVTKLYRHLCGGIIVTLSVIMTACSCVGEVLANGKTSAQKRCKRVKILAGTPDIYFKKSNYRQLELPYKCQLHPRCNLSRTITADVGLIFLQKNLTLTTHTEPMKVFSPDIQKFAQRLEDLEELETVCSQPSWHSNTIYYGVKPKFPGSIYQVKTQLISNEFCKEMHCNFENEGPACRGKLNETFCATSFQGNPPSVSEIGGPLLCHGMIFGITSVPSCDQCSPALYVGPSVWLDQISEFFPMTPQPLDCASFLPIDFALYASSIAVQLLGLM